MIAAGGKRRRSSLIRFKTISSQNNKVLMELEKKKFRKSQKQRK